MPDQEVPRCQAHGKKGWVNCWNCGGKGFHEDLHEMDPLWYDPDDTEDCDICNGEGGYWVCMRCSRIEATKDGMDVV